MESLSPLGKKPVDGVWKREPKLSTLIFVAPTQKTY